MGALALSGCSESPSDLSGLTRVGTNNDTIIEALGNQCKEGDVIGTKTPTFYCDFNYSIVYNANNTAIYIYRGKIRDARIKPQMPAM